jgi:hypothetical protein
MSWVNKAYGHLKMGRRLLHSSCDFFALPQETPDHWRLALKAHGTLRGLVPYGGSPEAQNERIPETIYRYAKPNGAGTVRVGGHWSLGLVLMEPLFYNLHLFGRWGAANLTRRHTHSNRDRAKVPEHLIQKFAVRARNATPMPQRSTTA